ncbi:galactose-binding domain-like protein [Gymnopilus junonius]|uniref:Galactose-binding domain-like protein n=1 Tax=Gymnopilus junonius TaxID=109634 RepID=A0A9P5P2J8_GYMJU|nr:galactose-binding domain-like protein [Gymnopilus junonius]
MTSGDLISLLNEDTSIKVSSTLEKANGKKNLIDNNSETCWTSQQGLPQFIQLGFNDKVIPKRLSFTFQGGFVGTRCVLLIPSEGSEKKDWQVLTTVYPEDVNRRQTFDLIPNRPKTLDNGVTTLKLLFEESSDFFGRVTVYDVQLEGTKAAP